MANSTTGARPQHRTKEICPHCKKPFSKVGLRNHISAKHGVSAAAPIPQDATPEIASAIKAIDAKIAELQALRASLLAQFPNQIGLKRGPERVKAA